MRHTHDRCHTIRNVFSTRPRPTRRGSKTGHIKAAEVRAEAWGQLGTGAKWAYLTRRQRIKCRVLYRNVWCSRRRYKAYGKCWACYVPSSYRVWQRPTTSFSWLARRRGQRATFNYGSGVLCIAHRLLLSLFARAALSSDHHLNLRFSDILVTSPPDILRHSS